MEFASLASIDRTPITQKMAEDGGIILAFTIETNREGLPAVSKSTVCAFRIYMNRELNSILSGNEIDYTNSLILLVKKMLRIIPHRMKGLV